MATHCGRNGLFVAVAVLAASGAWAHKPVVINGGPTTAETAYVIEDVDVSQVAYHEATPAQPTLWFTFEVEAGKELYLQLGVPKIDRYADLRPAMALLGPGMPELENVPFEVPAGYGGVVYSMVGVEPEVFNEEFTGTESWQFPAETPTVETGGKYYLVGYLPEAESGKFWVAVGTLERFGFGDIVKLPKTLRDVRSFHEVGPVGGLLFWAMVIGAMLLAILVWLVL